MNKIGRRLFIIFSVFLVLVPVFLHALDNIPVVKSINMDDNNYVTIEVEDSEFNIYYLYKNDSTTPLPDDENWKLLEGNTFTFSMDNNTYYAFLKNENGDIVNVEDLENYGEIISLKLNKSKVYVAIKGKYTVQATYEYTGRLHDTITWTSSNPSIATVNQSGKITGVKKGKTYVHAKMGDKDVYTQVIVTNVITVRPKKFNKKKPYLPCGKYSKAQNDLLDTILKDRINDVGYKTRAGAVEAARFLALEFPYKIRYFSENGRGTTNGIDGEGRFYHKGLYLNKSRYSSIRKKMHGPKTWGCSLYSRPSHGYRPNGLDCSGFISWVLFNGGFNVKDLGAGLSPGKDLTDYGKRIRFNKKVVQSGKVKVGDLLSSGGVNGGHIAIIAGEDKNYYYVAESLWTPPNVAVVIIPYSKKNLWKRYYYVMLMDKYYKKDGKLTKMWY